MPIKPGPCEAASSSRAIGSHFPVWSRGILPQISGFLFIGGLLASGWQLHQVLIQVPFFEIPDAIGFSSLGVQQWSELIWN